MSKTTVTYIPLNDGGYEFTGINIVNKKAHFYLGDMVTFDENARVYEEVLPVVENGQEMRQDYVRHTNVKIGKSHRIIELFKKIFNKNTKVKNLRGTL
jgi:hypothetical protein